MTPPSFPPWTFPVYVRHKAMCCRRALTAFVPMSQRRAFFRASAGEGRSGAFDGGGRLYAWGDNMDGRLGLPSPCDVTRPMPVGDNTVLDVAYATTGVWMVVQFKENVALFVPRGGPIGAQAMEEQVCVCSGSAGFSESEESVGSRRRSPVAFSDSHQQAPSVVPVRTFADDALPSVAPPAVGLPRLCSTASGLSSAGRRTGSPRPTTPSMLPAQPLCPPRAACDSRVSQHMLPAGSEVSAMPPPTSYAKQQAEGRIWVASRGVSVRVFTRDGDSDSDEAAANDSGGDASTMHQVASCQSIGATWAARRAAACASR